mmetsp:Transcript_18227/g.73030  ORF Transcript_18227/g.73030 Transcript_18227/m.73030 type:complete len:115 (-) Transcript_18227:756-1100(-)
MGLFGSCCGRGDADAVHIGNDHLSKARKEDGNLRDRQDKDGLGFHQTENGTKREPCKWARCPVDLFSFVYVCSSVWSAFVLPLSNVFKLVPRHQILPCRISGDSMLLSKNPMQV